MMMVQREELLHVLGSGFDFEAMLEQLVGLKLLKKNGIPQCGLLSTLRCILATHVQSLEIQKNGFKLLFKVWGDPQRREAAEDLLKLGFFSVVHSTVIHLNTLNVGPCNSTSQLPIVYCKLLQRFGLMDEHLLHERVANPSIRSLST